MATRIGAEGDGVGALADGAPVFVRGVLPGETVRIQPTGKRGEGWSAELLNVVAPSAERAEPPCPHFGGCGGCALQHWQAAPYGAWKAGLLDAALRRAGFVPDLAPLVTTPARTRRRMDFAVRREGRVLRLGLHAPRSREVVDLTDCHVLHPTLNALLPPLRETLRALTGLRREGAAIANLLPNRVDLLLRLDADLTSPDRSRLAAFAHANGVARITWARGDAAPELACLLRPPSLRFADVPVTPAPGGFLQASEAGEAALVAAVVAGLPALPARARIADLYAGCGTFSCPLAAHGRVSAFEGDGDAVAALRAAVNAAGLAGRIEPTQRDLVRQPLSAKDLSAFAAVVLDPPHAGAAAQTVQIAAGKVPRVIYVSCNPAALARDAAALHAAGYELLAATPIDQFLWSPRLESVCVFAL